MRLQSSGFTAVTGNTKRWIGARSPVSIRRLKMSNLTATSACDACCMITSHGRLPPQWHATIARPMTCQTDCTFRNGPGMDFKTDADCERGVHLAPQYISLASLGNDRTCLRWA